MNARRPEIGGRRSEVNPASSQSMPPAWPRSVFASLRDLRGSNSSQSGFALVITIVLLALLVLVVYSLSALGRVGTDVSAAGVYQAQARQHALLGLSQALGDLQRYAGEDDMLTGMAGITGIPAGSGQSARHWCGVWNGNGGFFRWLASGTEDAAIPALTSDAVTLVASGSVGTDRSEQEHVRVLREAVVVATRSGPARRLGNYAWWVGDEGAKLSAATPDREHAVNELTGIDPADPALDRALSYEQLVLVGQLRASFHAVGLTHFSVVGATLQPGLLNINSTNRDYWRGVAATYNRLKPSSAPTLATARFADELVASLTAADPGAGKAEGGPYPSVSLFLNSVALTRALAVSGGSLISFGDVMQNRLCVRSDTFRVRAYGDSVNPADSARIEAVAWCEAIVQRVKGAPTDPSGRFVLSYYRWLGPDDI